MNAVRPQVGERWVLVGHPRTGLEEAMTLKREHFARITGLVDEESEVDVCFRTENAEGESSDPGTTHTRLLERFFLERFRKVLD